MDLKTENDKIKDLIGFELDDEVTKRVKNFTLLWNIYETRACNRNADRKSILKNIEEIENRESIDKNKLKDLKTYFAGRYFNEDKTPTGHFSELVQTDNNIKNFITAELNKEDTDYKTLSAMMLIIYRYRNNLFHGNKQVIRLNDQINNFTNANELLIRVLEMMRLRGL